MSILTAQTSTLQKRLGGQSYSNLHAKRNRAEIKQPLMLRENIVVDIDMVGFGSLCCYMGFDANIIVVLLCRCRDVALPYRYLPILEIHAVIIAGHDL